MRITNGMLINNMLNHMTNNLSRMDRLQQQMATGKKIVVPSDDPIVASRSLKLRTDVSEIQQFERNANDAMSWIETTDTTLGKLTDVMQRARELGVQGANGTNSDDERNIIAQEIKELKTQVMHVGNATYAGRYLFSGYSTDKKLIEDDELSANYGKFNVGINSDVERIGFEIGIGDTINVNITGGELFNHNTEIPYTSGITKSDKAIPAFPINLTTANNTLNMKVDGEVISVNLSTGAYADITSISTELENKINELTQKSKDVTVTDSGGALVFTSGKEGVDSEIIINGGSAVNDLALNSVIVSKGFGPGNTKSDTGGWVMGENAISSLTIDGTNDTLGLNVNGSNITINVTNKTYADYQDLSKEIETQINADPLVLHPVSVRALGSKLHIQSSKFGNSSVVKIDASTNAATNLGLTVSNSYEGSLAQKGSLINDFEKFITALVDNNQTQIGEALENIDNNLNNILKLRADIGAKQNRVELTMNRIANDNVSFTKLLSDNEDVDMAKTIMELKSEENVYRASLSGGARIIQPTLLDFLR